MATLRQHPASFSSANLGFVSCACGLAGVVFPPLIVVALPTAHIAWWTWLSGREERGFGWAMAGMLTAHLVFGLWVILLGAMFAETRGAALAFIYLLLFLSSIACVLGSRAAKYFAAGSALAALALALLSCYVYQQREAARRTGCIENIRQIAFESSPTDDGYDQHPASLAQIPEEDGYSWIVKVLPYMEDESLIEEANVEAESATDSFLGDTPFE